MENEKIIAINGWRNYIFLYNFKGELCCVVDVCNDELEIVIYLYSFFVFTTCEKNKNIL
jgi:hypothetical protein